MRLLCRLEEELNACKNASESLETDVRAELERKGWNRKSLPDRILIVLQRRKAGSYSTGNTATNAAILTASVPNEVETSSTLHNVELGLMQPAQYIKITWNSPFRCQSLASFAIQSK